MNSLLVVFTILLFVVASPARQPRAGDMPEDVYRKIPEEQRNALKQTVDRLIQAEKSRDWKSAYALLDQAPSETEDNFVRKMKGSHTLVEFRPSNVTFISSDDHWNIQGCASFQGDQEGRGWVASVHARWAASKWYLSPVVIDLFGSEKKMSPRECPIPQHQERPAISTE